MKDDRWAYTTQQSSTEAIVNDRSVVLMRHYCPIYTTWPWRPESVFKPCFHKTVTSVYNIDVPLWCRLGSSRALRLRCMLYLPLNANRQRSAMRYR